MLNPLSLVHRPLPIATYSLGILYLMDDCIATLLSSPHPPSILQYSLDISNLKHMRI
jgi:hypothetical protein